MQNVEKRFHLPNIFFRDTDVCVCACVCVCVCVRQFVHLV